MDPLICTTSYLINAILLQQITFDLLALHFSVERLLKPFQCCAACGHLRGVELRPKWLTH